MANTRLSYMLLLVASMLLLLPAHTQAHAGHTGPTQTFAQSIGPYNIVITVELPTALPAPLYLDVVGQGIADEVQLDLRVVPRGDSFANVQPAQIRTLPGVQMIYAVQLYVDHPGDWELEVEARGPEGGGVARLPFTITLLPLPTYTIPLMVALGSLVLLMLLAIGIGVLAHRRQRPAPRWLTTLLGYALFACVIVVVIYGTQQLSTNVPSMSGIAPPSSAVPAHVNVAAHTTPRLPNVGEPLTLTLDLADGTTGLPVDDLIPYDDSLMHMLVIDADGSAFLHLHPARVAPGRFEAALLPTRPGTYTAYVEVARQNSSTQMIARSFQIAGTPRDNPPSPLGLGEREISAGRVIIAASQSPIVAGQPITLTYTFSAEGKPIQDIEPWLSRAGHLSVRSDDGAIVSHIAAVGPLAPSGLAATGVSYGPDVRFVYTFSQSGRYRLWAQFKRQDVIITIPSVIDVQ